MQENVTKILGIDYGKARIGLAISDDSYTLAKQLKTIKNSNLLVTLTSLTDIIINNSITTIVIGMPTDINGTDTHMSDTINIFISQLKEYLDTNKILITIIPWNETMTSYEAYDNMLEKGMTHTRIKPLLDQEAARIILQEYLDNKTKA